jgi:N-acetylmuramic acid 6-phosphate etherase
MLICADPKPLPDKMARCKDVYTHPGCRVLSLPCGPMALTGSTRMQSSTFEQLVASIALESALWDILDGSGIPNGFRGYDWYGKQFLASVEQLLSEKSLEQLAEATLQEQKVYEAGGLMTLYADDFLLDVLTDTTERSPTFMTPPFCSLDMEDQPQSWAFVKNPFLNTVSAWRSCFERTPRCLNRSAAEYRALGIKEADIQRIPPISLDALYEFEIGNEPDPEREGENTLSTWVGYGEDAPKEYFERAKRFAAASVWTVGDTEFLTVRTRMKLFEHLAMKMMLNSVSTLTMAKLGRIRGNYMAHLNISNKKLVDRATRMIADLCDVDYETANYELFYSKLLLESFGKTTSTTVETIDRLGQKHE